MEKGTDLVNFFLPNPHALWSGSKFEITFIQADDIDQDGVIPRKRVYAKSKDRWTRYSDRPKRDVFYFGIATCVPEIEVLKRQTYFTYKTNQKEDAVSNRIIQSAATILNIDYEKLTEYFTGKYQTFGVTRKTGLTYSTISMGSGEQRLFRIIETIY